MQSLQDQVAIVTGGAAGIGGATARRLAEEGASVLIADVNSDAAHANAERIREAGGTVATEQIDVSRREDIQRMIETAVDRWGRLDILVNNAWNRKGAPGNAVTLAESAWDYAMNAMVKALFLATKYAVPHMETGGRGSIVNIASVHGQLVAPRFAGL